MKRIDYMFIDKVTWDEVHSYEDCYGVMYMANYPWFPWNFRVEMPDRGEYDFDRSLLNTLSHEH
jgi:hypothetical protein